MKKHKFLLYIVVFSAALAVTILNKVLFFDFLRVSGTSMEPELKNDQIIMVNRLYYGLNNPFNKSLCLQWNEPEVGDVVLYRYNGRNIIKRCAATEGTHLEYSLDCGYTLIVGDKTYPLTETQYHYMYLSQTVPEGTILCIGDNAGSSIDSRNYGFIPTKLILGKVKCR